MSPASCAEQPVFVRTARHRLGSVRAGLFDLKIEDPVNVAVDDTVRVVAPSVFFHISGHKSGYDAKGLLGKVTKVYDPAESLSPNRPVKVQFTEPAKWIGHFEFEELEVV